LRAGKPVQPNQQQTNTQELVHHPTSLAVSEER
jgi:hypothetical protein